MPAQALTMRRRGQVLDAPGLLPLDLLATAADRGVLGGSAERFPLLS